VGAAVGTLSGFLVPYLHSFAPSTETSAALSTRDFNSTSNPGFDFAIMPNGVYCRYAF
jgi:hypothetical protein